MPELYAVIAEVTPYNFLSVYTPYSSTSANAYFLPPPTTLVGALAYAYKKSVGDLRELRDDGASPAVELVEQGLVRYAVAGVGEPFTIVNTIERVYQHPYLRKQHWKREEMTYTVAVRQQVLVRKLYILFIVASYSLARYSYAMTRIGRKESLVSVDRVFVAPVKELVDLSKKWCDTSFYFPLSIAKDYDPKDVWVEVEMPTPAKENFIKKVITTERFVVPKPFTSTLVKATVELNENGAVLSVNLDGKLLEVPVPRKVLM
jgi:CRISPR-associated protein Cas5a/b/c